MITQKRNIVLTALTFLIVLSMTAGLVLTVTSPAVVYGEEEGTGYYEERYELLYAPEQAYQFDTGKTASEQLEDLFTTIDLMDATIADLTAEMEAGNVTSEQITQMYIDRINAYDGKVKLNSIISINPNALNEARMLDEERANGQIRGPLHGIPILVKDNIDVAGMPTTGGSLALAHMVSDTDAFAVQQLRNAGAVIIAKANLSEFASSAIDSASLLGGTVHNAYDISRVPAGSSGGTGVAVTSNFAAAGLGTDTGGSIRNPSSYSNLYGIRPSKGLTSIHGVIPLVAERDTVGPMARTAEDLALVLEVIAGTDANDDFTQEANADQLVGDGYMSTLSGNGLQGKRIGYLTSSFEFVPPQNAPEEGSEAPLPALSIPDEKVDAMIKRARANLRVAGAEFVDLSDVMDDGSIYLCSGGASDSTTEYDFNKYLYEKGDLAPYKTIKALYQSGKVGIYHSNLPVEPNSIEFYADSFEETVNPYDTEINGYMRGKKWLLTMEGREAVEGVMEQYNIDAIMYIASFDVAPTYADELEELHLNPMGWEYGFTFGPALGLPEIVIPMGFGDTNEKVTSELPLGLRLVGRFGQEAELLNMAYAYEQQAGPSIRKMPENTPALEDRNLEAFLDALMDEVYSIDYSRYGAKPDGKIQLMLEAYHQAAIVDRTDPYAVYKAAQRLAQEYDVVMQELEDSGESIANASVSEIPDQIYTGHELTPLPEVTLNGKTLVPDEDFTVVYQNNVDVGQAAVTITGINSYTGTITSHFAIRRPFPAESGWLQYNGKWYLLDENGAVLTGWQDWEGLRYYLDPATGIMQTGWQFLDGSWYYFNSSGAMVTGWQMSGGLWYYLKADGEMAAGEWWEGYWLSADGAWTYTPTGSWKQDPKGWWFGDTSGWYAQNGAQRINGVEYLFDQAGYWIP